ncbi:hypothetical protein cco10_05713 [Campylobacter coli 90-3]|nr:hypothetical protein cco10_05713 [Campylobacter coli 90-3]
MNSKNYFQIFLKQKAKQFIFCFAFQDFKSFLVKFSLVY